MTPKRIASNRIASKKSPLDGVPLSELMQMLVDGDINGLKYLMALKRLKRGDPYAITYYWNEVANANLMRRRCITCTKLIPQKAKDKVKRGRKKLYCNRTCNTRFWRDFRYRKVTKKRQTKIRQEIEQLKLGETHDGNSNQ